MRVIRVAEEVGQVHNIQARREGREERVSGEAEVDAAEANAFKEGVVVAEFACRMDRNDDRAARELFHPLCHSACGLVMGVAC